jgi:hypothetical protein
MRGELHDQIRSDDGCGTETLPGRSTTFHSGTLPQQLQTYNTRYNNSAIIYIVRISLDFPFTRPVDPICKDASSIRGGRIIEHVAEASTKEKP